jgi:hypothetical protein
MFTTTLLISNPTPFSSIMCFNQTMIERSVHVKPMWLFNVEYMETEPARVEVAGSVRDAIYSNTGRERKQTEVCVPCLLYKPHATPSRTPLSLSHALFVAKSINQSFNKKKPFVWVA